MSLKRFGTLLIGGLLAVACSSADAVDDDTTESRPPSDTSLGTFPTKSSNAVDESGCLKMDIVFVIDNSSSMEDKQQNLIANFPKFASAIDGYRTKGGRQLDYRIAVTTTDIFADRGVFRRSGNGCDGGPARPWLERSDRNLVNAFSCRARVGIDGSTEEHPLQALQQALGPRAADANAGFLRPDALLAFVVLTDEDEYPVAAPGWEWNPLAQRSMTPYVDTFDALKEDRSRWAAAVIAGDESCGTSTTSIASGGARVASYLRDFTRQIGKSATFSPICTNDLTGGLMGALNGFTAVCGGMKKVDPK